MALTQAALDAGRPQIPTMFRTKHWYGLGIRGDTEALYGWASAMGIGCRWWVESFTGYAVLWMLDTEPFGFKLRLTQTPDWPYCQAFLIANGTPLPIGPFLDHIDYRPDLEGRL